MMKPQARHGALAGALLTAPLIAVSYLGWMFAGLPFAPFDLFDWVARALPGPIVTFGIDATVAVSRALNVGNMGAMAKTAEQAAAVGGLFLAGVIGGAVLFGALSLSDEPALLLGAILGAILGGFALVIEQQLNRIASAPFLAGPWVFATFVAWGLAFGWVYDRLREAGGGANSGFGPVKNIEDVDDVDDAEAPGRRRFLIHLGGTTITTTFAATLLGVLAGNRGDSDILGGGGRWSDTHAPPNADAAVVPVPGTRPELTSIERHYRIDTDTRAPRVDGARWRLKVDGLVARPLALTLDDLRQYEPMHQFVTLSCISNPAGGDLIGTIRWTGVSVKRLLQEMILNAAATHLRITSTDGFSEVVAIETIRNDERIMLAYAWDGTPLPAEHGFPLRIYIPDLYGMKQPKWIDTIVAIDRWEPGYWVARGWDRDGHVTITSVVDTLRTDGETAGGRLKRVAVGGIAYAGSRGVSRVNVRVDEGEWQDAQLREPLSGTTWVLWRADLSVPQGEHVFAVRAVDGQGRPQAAQFHAKRDRA
jgi:DMSO/TMAO reductase YedYZ molybdopterin-dependent catalytic subunit